MRGAIAWPQAEVCRTSVKRPIPSFNLVIHLALLLNTKLSVHFKYRRIGLGVLDRLSFMRYRVLTVNPRYVDIAFLFLLYWKFFTALPAAQ